MADKKSEDSDDNKGTAPNEKGAGSTIKFNDNITIHLDKTLPDYDCGEIKAFQAVGSRKIPENLIALACEPGLIPRWHSASIYAGIINPNAAKLVATGASYVPSAKKEKFFVIYENNWGARLLPHSSKLSYGIKQDQITDYFLPAIVSLLKDFSDKGFIHGGLRIENLYSGNTKNLKNFILGDSLTAPPSYLQPSLYEPIERGMADPIARGMGHFVDDVYSLGVLITIMIRHNDPLQGLSPDQILEEKIEKGSYAALTGKDRFTGAILELLRGMLHDEKSQRWTIEEVANWLDGQRINPRQPLKRKKSSRVFHLEGIRHTRPEILARELVHHPSAIVHNIEDEKLELWIKRSLEDKEVVERFEQALISASDAGINDAYPYRLVSRLSIAFDPPAPIRYKELSFFPDGFGTALSKAFTDGTDLNQFAEVLEQGLIMFWLNAQSDKTIDYGSVATRFESCRGFLKNKLLGFGLERCLYVLNSEAACLSSKLDKYYVKSPEELVIALEKLCKDKQIKDLMLDRHSIAFLSAKDSRILDNFLIELNSPESYKNILGNIWAITNIQKRYELPPFPHIATHIVNMMGPVLERFHDRNLRKRMQSEFDKIKKSGELSRVTAILENPEIIETDSKNFYKNMARFRSLEKEKKTLIKKLDSKDSIGRNMGRTVAAIASLAIAGIGIFVFIIMELSGTGVLN